VESPEEVDAYEEATADRGKYRPWHRLLGWLPRWRGADDEEEFALAEEFEAGVVADDDVVEVALVPELEGEEGYPE
jgi:hypothetical protein